MASRTLSSRLLTSLLLLGCLLAASGCGGGSYAARMQKRAGEFKNGASISSGSGSTTAAATIDPRLSPSPYEIYDSAGVKTGVTIYLPKEFVSGNSANFTNTETLGPTRLSMAGSQTSLMTYYYADTIGKKCPAIICFSRFPGGKVADAAQRASAEQEIIAATQKVAAPGTVLTLTDFPTAAGNWRKMTYNQRSKLPVGDANGPVEEIDARVDTYVMMTTNEGMMIQVLAPLSVTNTFDFFGAAEAGLKLMQAGPPAKTGTIP